MTPRRRYQIALLWLSLLALLRAIDLGIRAGGPGAFTDDLPGLAAGLAELAVHTAVLAALRGRKGWGWGLAVVWYPVWIALMAVRLHADYDPMLVILWTPFLALTAGAHTVLLGGEIREAYGITRQPWRSLEHWLPAIVRPGALVPALVCLFDPATAGCLWLTAAIATATASRVYRDG
jgi:hypothetical protein